jgi:hypothetical protein
MSAGVCPHCEQDALQVTGECLTCSNCGDALPPVAVLYRNHRDEIATRRITPLSVHFGVSVHHATPQWLLQCWDHDRRAERTYSLKDCDFSTQP